MTTTLHISWTCLVSGLLSFEHPSVLLFLLGSYVLKVAGSSPLYATIFFQQSSLVGILLYRWRPTIRMTKRDESNTVEYTRLRQDSNLSCLKLTRTLVYRWRRQPYLSSEPLSKREYVMADFICMGLLDPRVTKWWHFAYEANTLSVALLGDIYPHRTTESNTLQDTSYQR